MFEICMSLQSTTIRTLNFSLFGIFENGHIDVDQVYFFAFLELNSKFGSVHIRCTILLLKQAQQKKFLQNIRNYSQNGQNCIVLSQKRKKQKTFKNIKLSIIEHCVGQRDETCIPVFRFFVNIKLTMRQQKFGLFFQQL